MAWMTFEILINLFQAFLCLRYVKGCFHYAKKTAFADGLLLLSVTAYLSIYLFDPVLPISQQVVYLIPLVHALALSSEPKRSTVFWLFTLAVVMNLISTLTYPIFNLLPVIFKFSFPSFQFERFLCIIVTNITLFLVLEMIIRLKKTCTFPHASSYATFNLTLALIYMIENSVFDLYEAYSNEVVLPFFVIHIGLFGCVVLTIFLFHTVSSDSERENRYQAELAMLNLSRQHQLELAQMYEEFTQRQHDYKHHLQALQELVGSSDHSTAQTYLDTLMRETPSEEMIVTGSPGVDALLAAKRKLMRKAGIAFVYSPHPLASLPISTLDFCSIVGNLLDNAIEGVLRIPNIDKRPKKAVIHLSFSRSWDMFYIYCENPCDSSTIARQKDRFISSKQKSEPGLHGIGLHSIDTIASRAQGRTEYLIEDQTFCAKVVLPYLHEERQSHDTQNG